MTARVRTRALTERMRPRALVGRVRPHLPMLGVLLVIVVAAALVIVDRWRRGAIVFGIGTLIAGACRLCLPEEQVGLLAVRSRAFDSAALLAIGTAIVLLGASIDPLGTG